MLSSVRSTHPRLSIFSSELGAFPNVSLWSDIDRGVEGLPSFWAWTKRYTARAGAGSDRRFRNCFERRPTSMPSELVEICGANRWIVSMTLAYFRTVAHASPVALDTWFNERVSPGWKFKCQDILSSASTGSVLSDMGSYCSESVVAA